MTMPMYVSPEQLMKDRADYARKGIARGKAAAACTYSEGVLLCAENPSKTLRKAGGWRTNTHRFWDSILHMR